MVVQQVDSAVATVRHRECKRATPAQRGQAGRARAEIEAWAADSGAVRRTTAPEVADSRKTRMRRAAEWPPARKKCQQNPTREGSSAATLRLLMPAPALESVAAIVVLKLQRCGLASAASGSALLLAHLPG